MPPEMIQALMARYFAATRKMDVEAWLGCFAEDAVSHDPYGGTPLKGKEALRQFFIGVTDAFTAIDFTEDYLVVTADRAAVKFTAHGTGKNGRSAKAEGIDVFEVNRQGTIQTMWGYWDPSAMLSQLR